MKVKRVEVFKGKLELIKVFRISYGEWESVDTVYVKTELDDRSIGWGEAPPAPEITGDTVETIVGSIKYLSQFLKGIDINDIKGVDRLLREKLKGNSAAINGLINSIIDAISRSLRLPPMRVLGFRDPVNEVITDITVGLDKPDVMIKDAVSWVERGFKILKVKLGGHDELDVDRVKRIRDAVGSDVRIRVDANQAWSPKEAVRISKSLERYDVEMIEQPVKAWDLEGLKYVKEKSGIPIVADEAVHNSNDLKLLLMFDAVDGINIKLSKAGGLVEAARMIEIAKTFGKELMIGCMIESSLGMAIGSHLVASTGVFKYIDLDSDITLKSQPVLRPLKRSDDKIIIESKPGFDIEPDENKLEKMLTLNL